MYSERVTIWPGAVRRRRVLPVFRPYRERRNSLWRCRHSVRIHGRPISFREAVSRCPRFRFRQPRVQQDLLARGGCSTPRVSARAPGCSAAGCFNEGCRVSAGGIEERSRRAGGRRGSSDGDDYLARPVFSTWRRNLRGGTIVSAHDRAIPEHSRCGARNASIAL